jgi:hypothetical protein
VYFYESEIFDGGGSFENLFWTVSGFFKRSSKGNNRPEDEKLQKP